jgi:minimal PKS ketosynthase (KS/KS alpha)
MSATSGPGRRAVITAIGVVAPGGIGTKAYWKLLAEGRSATRTITQFDASAYRCQVAGECDFDPLREGLSYRETSRMDRATQLAVVAYREAIGVSGLEFDHLEPSRVGVAIGCAADRAAGRGREYGSMADELAWRVGAEGPVKMVSAGCTSGIDSVGYAAELIADGTADVVVTGGAEAPLSPMTLVCFDLIRASSTHNDDPAGACRPFDRTRDGIVLAEGAAILVVEELQHARRRGAHIYAEVAGFASRWNAYYMTNLDRDGRELAAAINSAMRRARLHPMDLDYVNAHGAASVQDDVYETQAFRRSLGCHAEGTPVSALKSMIGHSLGATGALEIAGCLLAFEEGVIPPTANLHEPDPRCDLDYVPLVARERRVRSALTVGAGFEGFQSAMVLRAVR